MSTVVNYRGLGQPVGRVGPTRGSGWANPWVGLGQPVGRVGPTRGSGRVEIAYYYAREQQLNNNKTTVAMLKNSF